MKKFLSRISTGFKRRFPRLSRIPQIPWIATPVKYTAEAVGEWNKDGATRLAAALAYYTIFSLAPLLVIVIAVAGFFLGESEVRGKIFAEMESLIGPSGTSYVRDLIQIAWEPGTGLVASLVGLGVLLFGATRAFAQLQEALNLIWGAPPRKGSGVWAYLRQRLLSFSLVLTIGFLLMVSLVLSAVMAALGKYFTWMVPSYFPLLNLLNWLVSFGVTVLLFAAIYKILPDIKVRWRNVWLGAAVAALLFSIGRYLIGLYLGRSSFGSVYGAAGSFVIILLWIYYSAQILFFGAEVTQVSARHQGRLFPGDEGYDAEMQQQEKDRLSRKNAQRREKPLTEQEAAANARSEGGEEAEKKKG